VHLLVVPNEHIPSLASVDENHSALLSHMLLVCKQMAAMKGLEKNGYRLVLNTGRDANQSVDHLHVHILGGQRLLPVFLR